jgi:hypothetical protein
MKGQKSKRGLEEMKNLLQQPNLPTFFISLLTALLLYSVTLPVHAGYVEIQTPPTINSPCKYTMQRMKAKVAEILGGRGWIPRYKKLGLYEPALIRSDYEAIITVTYTADTITIKYKDSKNLTKIKDGKTHIHENFNKWMVYLEKDAYVRLARGC